MRKVLSKINCFFITMGKARAAAQLSNMGYYTEAKNLMLQVDKC